MQISIIMRNGSPTSIRLIVLLFALTFLVSFGRSSEQQASNTKPSQLGNKRKLSDQDHQPLAAGSGLEARGSFKLPKIFDFGSFKATFKRTYGSILEEASRKRLYLARALRVSLTSIKYKLRLISYYFSINHLSDKRQEELDRLSGDLSQAKLDDQPLLESIKSNGSPLQADDEAALGSLDSARLQSDLGKLVSDDQGLQELEADIRSAEERRTMELLREELRAESLELDTTNPELQQTRAGSKRLRRERRHTGTPTGGASLPRRRSLPASRLIRPSPSTGWGLAWGRPQPAPPSNNPTLVEPGASRSVGLNARALRLEAIQQLSWWNIGGQPPKGRVQQLKDGLSALGEGLASTWCEPRLPGRGLATNLVSFASSVWQKLGPSGGSGATQGDLGEEVADQVYLDHNRSGCLGPVHDQGPTCGSCYAFAVVALAEWLYCKQTGRLLDFSEQYLVDCGQPAGLGGCRGGDAKSAATFIQTYGLELAQRYPYASGHFECPYADTTDPKTMGYIRMKLDHGFSVLISDFERVLAHSPIYVSASNRIVGFYEYSGGVLDGHGCNSDNSSGHALLLVGHGIEDGREYWLLRNSFGLNWGLEGHLKLWKKSVCIWPTGWLFGLIDQDKVTVQVETNALNAKH